MPITRALVQSDGNLFDYHKFLNYFLAPQQRGLQRGDIVNINVSQGQQETENVTVRQQGQQETEKQGQQETEKR